MKGTNIMKQIIFSLILLSLVACSKEQEQEVIQCGEDMMPPSAEFIKEWEKKQGEVKVQMAAKRHP